MDPTLSIGGTDVGTMLTEFAKSIPNMTLFVTSFAYMIGMIFVVSGAIALKKHTDDPRGEYLKYGVVSIFVGVLCLYLITTIGTTTETIFGSNLNNQSIIYNAPDGMDAKVILMMTAIFQFIRFVGLIAFIRGLMILRDSANARQSGNNLIGKALTHIIGGCVAMNLQTFLDILKNTFGM